MLRHLMFPAVLMVAVWLCGMTSKQATEIASSPLTQKGTCCRMQNTDNHQPQAFSVGAKVTHHATTGVVLSVKGENLSHSLESRACFRDLINQHRFTDAAVCFMDTFRQEFKMDHPSDELMLVSERTDDLGMTHIRLRQTYADLSIWPCAINMHFSATGHIYWVHGDTIPTPRGMSTQATLSETDAREAAAAALGQTPADCGACTAELMILADHPEDPKLVYRVSAINNLVNAWELFVDAHSGAILKKATRIRT